MNHFKWIKQKCHTWKNKTVLVDTYALPRSLYTDVCVETKRRQHNKHSLFFSLNKNYRFFRLTLRRAQSRLVFFPVKSVRVSHIREAANSKQRRKKSLRFVMLIVFSLEYYYKSRHYTDLITYGAKWRYTTFTDEISFRLIASWRCEANKL